MAKQPMIGVNHVMPEDLHRQIKALRLARCDWEGMNVTLGRLYT
jgi:hypothetical protein